MKVKELRLQRPEPKESDVMSALKTALAMHPNVAWAHRFNTAAGKLVRANGSSQFMSFGFPGCPDFVGQLRDGRILCIEAKRPSGKTSPEQERFLDCVRANGGVAVVARSVDDLLEALA